MSERRSRRGPHPLSELVPRVLDELGLSETGLGARISRRWEELVGPEVARHCQPTGLRGGVLEISVDASVWCQQLQMRRAEILAGLRRGLGEEAPTDLWLRVG